MLPGLRVTFGLAAKASEPKLGRDSTFVVKTCAVQFAQQQEEFIHENMLDGVNGSKMQKLF
jgi:hypothetical protein